MLNQCTLTGNLGGDSEVFYSSEGNPVASFSLSNYKGWVGCHRATENPPNWAKNDAASKDKKHLTGINKEEASPEKILPPVRI